MTCIRIHGGIMCVSPSFRLPLADGTRVYMAWNHYCGPIFYRDRAEAAESANASLVERVGKLEAAIRKHIAGWVVYPDSPLWAALAPPSTEGTAVTANRPQEKNDEVR